MEINEDRALQNDRQGEHAPANESEHKRAVQPYGKMRRLRPRHDREERGDPGRGKNMESAGKRVACSRFTPPCIRSESLEPMKNEPHPKPAREDGHDAGDKAGEERVQSIHEESASVAFSTLRLQFPF
jgi:hypothetical protein